MRIECLECGSINEVSMDEWVQSDKARHCTHCGDQLFLPEIDDEHEKAGSDTCPSSYDRNDEVIR